MLWTFSAQVYSTLKHNDQTHLEREWLNEWSQLIDPFTALTAWIGWWGPTQGKKNPFGKKVPHGARQVSHHYMAPVDVSCWGCTPTPMPQESSNAQRAQVPGPPRLGSCTARRQEVRLSVLKYTECHHIKFLRLAHNTGHSSMLPSDFLSDMNSCWQTFQPCSGIQGFLALNQIWIIWGLSSFYSRQNALPVRRKVG